MASSASTTATSVSCSAPTDSTMTTSSSTMATSYRKSNEHQKTKKSLPELSKEVIADKVLIKSLENYVSAGDRSLLNITRFNDITEVNVSYDIKTKINEMPECEELFKKLFNPELIIKECDKIDDDKIEEESKVKDLFFQIESLEQTSQSLIAHFKTKPEAGTKQ